MHKLNFYLLYFGLAVDIGKTYFFGVTWFTPLSTVFKNKKMPLILLSAFLLSIMLVSVNGPYFYLVNAYVSANSFAMQSQSGAIGNNCASNFYIQTQSSNNGKTGTATKSTCNDESSLSSSSSGILSDKRDNLTLLGTIVSSEYDQKDGVIVNSVFGNWSLTTKNGYPIDFKSSFTLQPILYGYNNVSSPKTFNDGVVLPGASNNTTVSAAPNLDQTQKQHSNITLFSLSNFNVYSVQQQNSDNAYSGYIDVVQDVHSNDLKKPDQTKIYKRTGVSISIMDYRFLFINFDKNSHLFDEFKNIPLVGLVRSNQK
jgi:hypothetical protein